MLEPLTVKMMTPGTRSTAATLRRGLTLLELAVVLAVLAVLSALAVPSMSARLRAERLQSAAEMFAADVADARHEAARRGQGLHIEAQAATTPGPAWCWSVATAAACPCGEATPSNPSDSPMSPTAAACRLKRVPASEHPGVNLLQSQPVYLQADGQASPGLAAVFAAGDRQLQVHVTRFGRARVCDPAGTSTRVPKC